MAARTSATARGAVNVQSWNILNTDVTGDAANNPGAPDKTVQVSGTFNSGTITMQGSMDSINWATLHDPSGVALTFTAAGINTIAENPVYIRPLGSGFAGAANVLVQLCARG